jgi:nucleotide-binding universal stress UspA family protein
MMAAYISDIPEHGPWSEEMVNRPRETCLQYLAAVRDRLAVSDAELVVKVNYPHEAILETAREVDASLIVASTHGRSGLNRWMYGSTAGRLLHTSHVPLLVVGKEAAETAASGFAPKHILIPLDGSSLAEAALPAVLELASAFGAKVTLVRVAPFSVEAFPMMVPQMYWPTLDDELVASATAYLEKMRSTIPQPVEVKVLQGARADALLGFIETTGVDLVVMTTHGRAGVQRAVLGSTADRMLQGRAPVLLIRPEEPAAS